MAKQRLGSPKVLGLVLSVSGALVACQSGPRAADGTNAASETAPRPAPTPVKVEGVRPIPFQSRSAEKSTPAFDVTLSSAQAPDGSIVAVGLHPLMEIDIAGVSVKFEGKEFPVFPSGPAKDLAALVVMPFNSKPRMSKIELAWHGGTAEFPIEIIDGGYPSEKLNVDEKKVNPPKKVMKRIIKETKEIGALYRKIRKERLWGGPFQLPIDSEVTSRFGNKRLFNGSMKSFHQGLDLRARTPTPIRAPEGAEVVLAKDLYFTGNTVILDHGYGLFTIYAHMSRLDVKVGDRVTKNQTLGLSGATGRAG